MEAWLKKAERFREKAAVFLEDGDYDFACFAAQQSAEFLLKALIIGRLGARPLTHSLFEMAKVLAQSAGVELGEDLAKCAKELEQHYVQARYPDARLTPYERWEAERCLRCLEGIWRWAASSR